MSEQQRWDEEYEKYVKEVAATFGGTVSAPVKREREAERRGAVNKLEEARTLIAEALSLIREATDEDAYVETYLGAPLSVIVGEGKYMSHDLNIQTVIRELGM